MDVERGVHHLTRVIRDRVSHYRDVVAQLSGIANGRFDAGVCNQANDDELMYGEFFGELMVEECLRVPGTLAVCIREVQKSLMQSSKRMIESKIQSLGGGSRFKILHDRIITPGDGLIIFQRMQDATAESIKSLEGFRIAWIEEAQTLSQRTAP